MRKMYMKPELAEIKIETVQFLAASDPSQSNSSIGDDATSGKAGSRGGYFDDDEEDW